MQYGCGNDDVSGPPGCLQYYTATTGTIQSFNFPQPTVGTITETGTFKLSRFFALDLTLNYIQSHIWRDKTITFVSGGMLELATYVM